MCEVTQPTPADRICDPAAGTGGFLCNAYQYVLDRFEKDLDRDQKRALQEELVEGMELSPKVGRMCAMNLHLHGIGGTGSDSWTREPCRAGARNTRRSRNPNGKAEPALVNEEGDTEKEEACRREDTDLDQQQAAQFVQHIYSLLKIDSRRWLSGQRAL
jgi:type I restriction enzyme M protein